jgi:hypothetical protein
LLPHELLELEAGLLHVDGADIVGLLHPLDDVGDVVGSFPPPAGAGFEPHPELVVGLLHPLFVAGTVVDFKPPIEAAGVPPPLDGLDG